MRTALKFKKKTRQSVLLAHARTTKRSARYDPTHTTSLRNTFVKDCRRRFKKLCQVITKSIVDEDCFALNPGSGGFAAHVNMVSAGRFAFDYPRSAEKVEEFMKWVDKQIRAGILETTTRTQLGRAVEDAWQNQYITSAYQKGILRARQEMVDKGYDVPPISDSSALFGAFNQPFHVDRVGLIYTRVYSDLKGITALMDTQISRVLAKGMADGTNPRNLARLLTRTITGPVGDLSLTDTLGRFIPAERRAEVLARTEIIRAHHEATIQEYRNYGVAGVSVEAEWQTAGDDRVCDECESMEGQVFSLDDIEGMLPAHPQCRCVALPVLAGGE
jgi:SPP1 gp7 family putative phage head morphogenesis protein